jgi:hypothetical protein
MHTYIHIYIHTQTHLGIVDAVLNPVGDARCDVGVAGAQLLCGDVYIDDVACPPPLKAEDGDCGMAYMDEVLRGVTFVYMDSDEGSCGKDCEKELLGSVHDERCGLICGLL